MLGLCVALAVRLSETLCPLQSPQALMCISGTGRKGSAMGCCPSLAEGKPFNLGRCICCFLLTSSVFWDLQMLWQGQLPALTLSPAVSSWNWVMLLPQQRSLRHEPQKKTFHGSVFPEQILRKSFRVLLGCLDCPLGRGSMTLTSSAAA